MEEEYWVEIFILDEMGKGVKRKTRKAKKKN